jgi:hypothetical protein
MYIMCYERKKIMKSICDYEEREWIKSDGSNDYN